MPPVRVHLSVTPGRAHNLYDELVQAPPEGVQYSFPDAGEVGYAHAKGAPPSFLARIERSPAFRAAYAPVLRHVMGGVGVGERARRLRGWRPPWDVYHSTGGIHAPPDPWVVGFESSLDFFGYGTDWRVEIGRRGPRAYVRRKLLGPWCRRILPWTEAARASVLGLFPDDAKALDAKMEVLPLAIRAGPEPPARKRDGPVRLLFVGSKNFPQDFLPKGGNLALETFARLRKTHDVELVMRAAVPAKYRERYGEMPGLRIVDKFLSDDELAALYHEADVFLFPMCHTPGMVLLEAMRAGLPAVMLDVWANREIVEEGETGFLVPPAPHVKLRMPTGAPDWNQSPEFLRSLEEDQERVVADLAERTSRLVESAALRERMGRRARERVVTGPFSVPRRNAALKRIYEDAARR